MNDIEKYKVGWGSGLPETPCGSGSMIKNTIKQQAWLPKIVEKYNIRSIADIGAGDMNWISKIEWPHEIDYKPFDLIPRHHLVSAFDVIAEIPPKVDLVMCFWVLNHLDDKLAQKAMDNIKKSGSKYLMVTNIPEWKHDYIEKLPYIDILYLEDRKGKEIRLIEM